jgi:hypothetical protein
VFEVFKTQAVFALRSPFGIPSPSSPLEELVGNHGPEYLVNPAFSVVGGIPHQSECTKTIPSAKAIFSAVLHDDRMQESIPKNFIIG